MTPVEVHQDGNIIEVEPGNYCEGELNNQLARIKSKKQGAQILYGVSTSNGSCLGKENKKPGEVVVFDNGVVVKIT